MPEAKEASPATTNRTAVERKSDRELVVTRTFNAPAHIVFEAWSKPELFKLWWVPKSAGMSLLSCDMDVRSGGAYRLVFRHPSFDQPMAFFGTYGEVTPNKRLVWTNEESDQGAVTTVTFEENDGKTPYTNFTPQKRLSTKPSAVRRKVCPNSSRSWMSCSQASPETAVQYPAASLGVRVKFMQKALVRMKFAQKVRQRRSERNRTP